MSNSQAPWVPQLTYRASRARAGEAGEIESSFVILLVFLRVMVCCWSGCQPGVPDDIVDGGLVGAVGGAQRCWGQGR